jgi:hypothetical protein
MFFFFSFYHNICVISHFPVLLRFPLNLFHNFPTSPSFKVYSLEQEERERMIDVSQWPAVSFAIFRDYSADLQNTTLLPSILADASYSPNITPTVAFVQPGVISLLNCILCQATSQTTQECLSYISRSL